MVAAELVETSRLWARTVAAIEPEWVEPVAAHLVKRSYSEPRWSRSQGSAVASEKVTLYGIPLIADRTVLLHRIDPVLARELFIRHALVEGDWQTRHHFFRDNQKLLEEAAALEQRARRRGLVAGEEALFAFYDARVPADAVSARHFDTWWKQARHETPDLLTLTLDTLLSAEADELDAGDYPEVWTSASAGLGGSRPGAGLSLSYAFEPGSDTNGVTIDIPLNTLNQARPEEFSWQVPGLRMELVTELIRSLPKTLRRELVPAPNVAREILADLRRETARRRHQGDHVPRAAAAARRAGAAGRLRPGQAPAAPAVHLPRARRDQGRRVGQGPGRAAAPAAAQGPRHPVRPRHRADQDRGHHLGLRPAAQGLHRRRGQGLPGARRRGPAW